METKNPETMLDTGLEDVVFKSSIHLVFYQGILQSVKICLAALVVYLVCVWIDKVKFYGSWLLYGMMIALVIGLVFVCLTRVISISVDGKEVVFKRRKKVYQTFSVAEEQFSTLIENQTVNGLAFYTRRYLRINEKLYECCNFSKKTFSELDAYVQQIQQKINGVISDNEIMKERINPQEAEFTIPKAELLKKEKSRSIKIGVECIGVGIVLLVVWFFTIFRRNEVSLAMLIFSGVGIVAMFIVIPILMEMLRLKRYRGRLPKKIRLQEYGIQVDDKSFAYDGMTTIQMTPVTYIRSGQYSYKRKLKITYNGKTFEYHVGDTQMKEYEYEDYEALLEELKQLCSICHIKFILDL